MAHQALRRATASLSAFIFLGAAAVVTAAGTAAAAPVQRTLYASPSGSGSSCTLAAPCSLTGARDLVRTLDAAMTGDIVVDLRGGTYRLSGPFQLGAQDSGQHGHTVVYQAYPGEVPVLSGARQVTGFSLFDSSKNIYRAAVTAGTQSSQLFVNGVRAVRARTGGAPGGFTLSGSSFVTADSSYLSYTNVTGVQVVDDVQWKQLRCPLASITATSSGGSSLNVNPTCFAQNNTSVANVGFPFNGAGLPTLTGVSWIENAYQLLDAPGEFYLDSAAGYLYYIPRSGENPVTADVELPVQQELVDLSGAPGHLTPVNDTAPGITYTGSWSYVSGRSFGDFGNDVHSTTTDGDSVSYSFTGSGIEILSEKYSDEGDIAVYVDGSLYQTVSAYDATERLAQQAVITVSGLTPGAHTVKLVKQGGSYLVLDALTVIPTAITAVHDITLRGLTFAYTTWNQPSASGYLDNQSGVLWDPSTDLPVKTPAAIQVHRGSAINLTGDVIEHTGDAGIDYADGTQNSAITGNWITDTSATGVQLGESDDYYVTLPALQTSGDTVTQNTITHVGFDYHDDVGIWAGYTLGAVLSHNEIGYSPYGGISLGWGWGWQSSCALQAKQGLTCRHGTDYAGGNQILDNDIHNIMQFTSDNGAIYTLGGQGGGNGTLTGVISGNVGAEAAHSNNMLYADEGSSYWQITDNVIRFGGANWVGLWTPTINNISISGNYADNASYLDNGTDISLTQATIVTNGAWPSTAQSIIAAAGPSEQYRALTGQLDDDNLAITYSGSWIANILRNFGDLDDGIHSTTANGGYASLTFTGTGVSWISEKNSDEGDAEIYLDGVDKGSVSAYAATRQARQVLYSIAGLTPGSHTIEVEKTSGSYLLVDGFEVTRTVDDDDAALAYTGSWYDATGRGLGDYGDDVHATTANGDVVTVTFYGTGISYFAEKYSDEGTIGVTLDGTPQAPVCGCAVTRSAQQVLYSVSGLTAGRHTLTLTKLSGSYLLVDRFDVT